MKKTFESVDEMIKVIEFVAVDCRNPYFWVSNGKSPTEYPVTLIVFDEHGETTLTFTAGNPAEFKVRAVAFDEEDAVFGDPGAAINAFKARYYGLES